MKILNVIGMSIRFVIVVCMVTISMFLLIGIAFVAIILKPEELRKLGKGWIDMVIEITQWIYNP